jgi:hypothetical protein
MSVIFREEDLVGFQVRHDTGDPFAKVTALSALGSRSPFINYSQKTPLGNRTSREKLFTTLPPFEKIKEHMFFFFVLVEFGRHCFAWIETVTLSYENNLEMIAERGFRIPAHGLGLDTGSSGHFVPKHPVFPGNNKFLKKRFFFFFFLS